MQDASREDPDLADQPWRSPLDELERTLQEVGRAIGLLRAALEASSGGPSQPHLRVVEADPGDTNADEPGSVPEAAEPVVAVGESELDTTISHEPQLTEFQKVWERHKQASPEAAAASPAAVEEPEQDSDDSFDWSADKESDADAEGEASQLAGYEEVWARLKKTQGNGGELEKSDREDASGARTGETTGSGSNFDKVWERLNREREGRSTENTDGESTPHRLENLPTEYRMTVEDRDGTPVDLISLHRALMAFAAADDISLVGYAKGTAIVGLRTAGELDLEQLASVIGTATTRQCEVIPQDQGKLFLRLSDQEEGEEFPWPDGE